MGNHVRSKAPLRIGLAGGGTDTSPYYEIYGGAVLNATISMYAYATIEPREDGTIIFDSFDKGEFLKFKTKEEIVIDGKLDILKGIYNRVVRDFTGKALSFKLTTHVDALPGSGLGTSSTLVVAILGAFIEWLGLPLGEYDVAHLAYEIERVDLQMIGGKQDQYAATFGGVNFMEFYKGDKTIVNPLRIRKKYLDELSCNLLLYYTETSRLSSDIIEKQTINIKNKKTEALEGMHKLKEQATMMKEALLKGNLDQIGEILNFGWRYKKQLAKEISSHKIDSIYEEALKSGATGGKVSGAGGGGYMIFYCPNNSRYRVIEALNSKFGGYFKQFNFTEEGLTTWKI